MNHTIKSFFKIPVLLLLSSLLLVQCSKDDAPAVQLNNLDATLSANSDLSLFKAAIAQAKLESFTKGPGPFTLLAPTNAALNAAGITTATLPTLDSTALTALVLNHMQNVSRTSYEIPDGPNAPMASMAGFNNYAYKDKAANKIYISGASVTTRDINCGNGIIHKIDKVLFVPAFPLITLLNTNSNYSLMVQAITKAGLTATFSPSASAPATVFALDNATMTANGYDAVTIAGLSGAALTTLSNILKYHIVTGRNFSTDLKAGNLKTVLATNVVISFNSGVFVKGTSNASPFGLTLTDVAASNGVLHQVGGMLKP